jgi:hypothetical protein
MYLFTIAAVGCLPDSDPYEIEGLDEALEELERVAEEIDRPGMAGDLIDAKDCLIRHGFGTLDLEGTYSLEVIDLERVAV